MRIRVSRRCKRSKQWSSLCGSGSRTDAINFLWCRLGQAVLPHSRAHSKSASQREAERERESEAVQGRQSCMAECTSKAVCSGQRQRQRAEAQAESFNRPQQTCNFIRKSVETARDRVTEQCRTLKKTKRVVGGGCVCAAACLPACLSGERGIGGRRVRQAGRQ